MTGAMLEAPMHPGKQLNCLEHMTKYDNDQTPAPTSCRKDHTDFPRQNKTNEPENMTEAGSNNTSPTTNEVFMAMFYCPMFGACKSDRKHHYK
jgi:hypothetical protein